MHDRLDATGHLNSIISIVAGQVQSESENVNNGVAIGDKQMRACQATWTGGVYAPLAKKVVTMEVHQKHVKIESECVFDTGLIYARVISLINS